MSVIQVVCSWVQIVCYVSWNASYSFYFLFLKMVLMLPKWYTLVCNTLLFDQVYAIQLVTSISVRVQSAWPDHSISWKLVSVYNLCKFWMQGVVYWQPPESAMNKIEKIIREPAVSRYGSDDGIPELREALLEKVNSLFVKWEMRTRFICVSFGNLEGKIMMQGAANCLCNFVWVTIKKIMRSFGYSVMLLA